MKKHTPFKNTKVILFILMSFPVCAHEGLILPSLGSQDVFSEKTPAGNKDNEQAILGSKSAQILTNEAQQGFQNLTVEGAKNQIYQYGKGVATQAAQSQVEKILSPYGHVKTTLNLSDNGNLDGSSLDYLLPWYAGESTLIFNQFSTHSKDGRKIANLGTGVRYNINKDWLVGMNAFYDYDISRGHRRGSIGSEVWTNYLKLSGNYYIPLSSWKASKDLDNYEERPASGWDIRLQTYLPAYPQLGTSLVYEQYYGDQVALFGSDNLEEDPSSVELGVDYTPVPLITLGASYKQGNSGINEITANMSVDYHIGTPMAKQLDPSAVTDMRTLAGSRMDFVDRNNDIVLEYREVKDLDIDVYLKPSGTAPQCIIADDPDEAQAYEGCHWTLNADIKSHRKIVSASWVPVGGYSAEHTLGLPALSPASNISTGQNNHWTLTFPAWVNSTAANANEYQLAVTFSDDKGDTKQSNIVKIKVAEAPVNYSLAIANSAESDKAMKIMANGRDTADLVTSGAKVSGLQGETTTLSPENMDMKFHAYHVTDKNHEHEITIHSSKDDCNKTTGCLYYVKSQDQGKATVASTMAGTYSFIATPTNKDTEKTNAVVVDFNAGNKEIVTAIVDTRNPTINLTEIKNNQLLLGHEYQFKVAYDSNRNGKWDASDRETISDTNPTPIISLVNYKWLFDGVNQQGEKGGKANSDTDNHNLTLPATNAQAGQVLASAGSSGLQGLELKVSFDISDAGSKQLKELSAK